MTALVIVGLLFALFLCMNSFRRAGNCTLPLIVSCDFLLPGGVPTPSRLQVATDGIEFRFRHPNGWTTWDVKWDDLNSASHVDATKEGLPMAGLRLFTKREVYEFHLVGFTANTRMQAVAQTINKLHTVQKVS